MLCLHGTFEIDGDQPSSGEPRPFSRVDRLVQFTDLVFGKTQKIPAGGGLVRFQKYWRCWVLKRFGGESGGNQIGIKRLSLVRL